ncbi:hypothetical protein D3C87_1555120 [compost metagenome]
MRIPRRRCQFGGHAEGRAISRQGVVIREVIDHFLQPHRAFRWQTPLIEQAADVGVSASVDVSAEGRDRRFGNAVDRVIRQRLILLSLFIAIALWIKLTGRHRRETGDRGRKHAALGHRCIGRDPLVLHQRFGFQLRLGRWRHRCRLGFRRNSATGNGQQQPGGETLGGRTEEMQREGHVG